MYYSNEDFENFYVRYKAEGLPRKISIREYCIRNKVSRSLFDKWYRDTRHRIEDASDEAVEIINRASSVMITILRSSDAERPVTMEEVQYLSEFVTGFPENCELYGVLPKIILLAIIVSVKKERNMNMACIVIRRDLTNCSEKSKKYSSIRKINHL